MATQKLISLVIPIYNEAQNLPPLYDELVKHLTPLPYDFEVLLIDDGSSDASAAVASQLAKEDDRFRLIQLARNFGKEAAVSAGLEATKGKAAVIMDADLQMPPRLINKFINRWEKGAEVVVGVFAERNMSPLKKFGAHSFYRIMQTISRTKITPNATDFRLLDREVIDAFNDLTERNRMTRGLIDWLGYKRSYVRFKQEARRFGQPAYTYRKLINLAVNSFTSYSLLPLKLAGYLGFIILALSVPTGLFMYVERYILDDPLRLLITGTDMLAILTLFLVGIILACMGLISLYIAHIHDEVTNRPLYITRKSPLITVPAAAEAREVTKEARQKRAAMLRKETVEG
jgi:glycosyltransferase involved in cell wall biosynthesis